MRVALSLGHNPDAPGAGHNGLVEHTSLARLFGHVLFELLSKDIKTYIVPTGSLSTKVDFINNGNYDLAMELHLNADPDPDEAGDPVAEGCEVICYTGSRKGRKVADKLQTYIVNYLPVRDRGVKERSDLKFLRDTNCPAVILEPEFIDNEENIEWVVDGYIHLAKIIAAAITRL